MKKHLLGIEIFTLLLFGFFSVLLFYSIGFSIQSLEQIILMSLILLMMLLTFALGFIRGVVMSLLVLILLGIYITYEVVLNQRQLPWDYLMLMIAIPVGSFIIGSIQRLVHQSKIKCERCSYIADKLVHIDETTGFGNGREFLVDLEIEMAKSKRYQYPLTVGILEIQYYQELLRLYGDNADRVFEKLAEAINATIRIEDTKYRVEKDRIALILPHTSLKDAKILKNRLKDGIAEIEIPASKDVKKSFLITSKLAFLEYHKDIINNVEYKSLAVAELEYDV